MENESVIPEVEEAPIPSTGETPNSQQHSPSTRCQPSSSQVETPEGLYFEDDSPRSETEVLDTVDSDCASPSTRSIADKSSVCKRLKSKLKLKAKKKETTPGVSRLKDSPAKKSSGSRNIWSMLGVFKCTKCGFTATEEGIFNVHTCSARRISVSQPVLSTTSLPKSPNAESQSSVPRLLLPATAQKTSGFRKIVPKEGSSSSLQKSSFETIQIINSSLQPSKQISEGPGSQRTSETIETTNSSHQPNTQISEGPESQRTSETIETTNSSHQPNTQISEGPESQRTSETIETINSSHQPNTEISEGLGSRLASTENNKETSQMSTKTNVNIPQQIAQSGNSSLSDSGKIGFIVYDTESECFKCIQCGFIGKGTQFIEHLIYQMYEKPYHCLYCKEYFKDRVEFQRHCKDKHPQENVKCKLHRVIGVKALMDTAKNGVRVKFAIRPRLQTCMHVSNGTASSDKSATSSSRTDLPTPVSVSAGCEKSTFTVSTSSGNPSETFAPSASSISVTSSSDSGPTAAVYADSSASQNRTQSSPCPSQTNAFSAAATSSQMLQSCPLPSYNNAFSNPCTSSEDRTVSEKPDEGVRREHKERERGNHSEGIVITSQEERGMSEHGSVQSASLESVTTSRSPSPVQSTGFSFSSSFSAGNINRDLYAPIVLPSSLPPRPEARSFYSQQNLPGNQYTPSVHDMPRYTPIRPGPPRFPVYSAAQPPRPSILMNQLTNNIGPSTSQNVYGGVQPSFYQGPIQPYAQQNLFGSSNENSSCAYGRDGWPAGRAPYHVSVGDLISNQVHTMYQGNYPQQFSQPLPSYASTQSYAQSHYSSMHSSTSSRVQPSANVQHEFSSSLGSISSHLGPPNRNVRSSIPETSRNSLTVATSLPQAFERPEVNKRKEGQVAGSESSESLHNCQTPDLITSRNFVQNPPVSEVESDTVAMKTEANLTQSPEIPERKPEVCETSAERDVTASSHYSPITPAASPIYSPISPATPRNRYSPISPPDTTNSERPVGQNNLSVCTSSTTSKRSDSVRGSADMTRSSVPRPDRNDTSSAVASDTAHSVHPEREHQLLPTNLSSISPAVRCSDQISKSSQQYFKRNNLYVCLRCRCMRFADHHKFYAHVWEHMHAEGKRCESCRDSEDPQLPAVCSQTQSLVENVSSRVDGKLLNQMPADDREKWSRRLLQGTKHAVEANKEASEQRPPLASTSPPLESASLSSSASRDEACVPPSSLQCDKESVENIGNSEEPGLSVASADESSTPSLDKTGSESRGPDQVSSASTAVRGSGGSVNASPQGSAGAGGCAGKDVDIVTETNTDSNVTEVFGNQPTETPVNDRNNGQTSLEAEKNKGSHSKVNEQHPSTGQEESEAPAAGPVTERDRCSVFFICYHCDFSCDTAIDFTMHLNSDHSDQSVFPCFHCNYQGQYTTDLTNHISAHTTGVSQMYLCPFSKTACQHGGTDNLKLLSLHLKSHHQTETSFCCQTCGAVFEHDMEFLLHLRVNSMTLYTCSKCPSRFLEKRAVQLHFQSCHSGPLAIRVVKTLLCLERKKNGYQRPLNPLALRRASEDCFDDGPLTDASCGAQSNLGAEQPECCAEVSAQEPVSGAVAETGVVSSIFVRDTAEALSTEQPARHGEDRAQEPLSAAVADTGVVSLATVRDTTEVPSAFDEDATVVPCISVPPTELEKVNDEMLNSEETISNNYKADALASSSGPHKTLPNNTERESQNDSESVLGMCKLADLLGSENLDEALKNSLYGKHGLKYRCCVCEREFSVLRKVHSHLFEHLNVPLISCPRCQFSSSGISQFKEHCKKTHPGEKMITNYLMVHERSLVKKLNERPLTLEKFHDICNYLVQSDASDSSQGSNTSRETSNVQVPPSASSSVQVPPSTSSSVQVPPSASSSVQVPPSASRSVQVPLSASSSVKVPPSASSSVQVPLSASSSVQVPPSANSSVQVPPSASSSVQVLPSASSSVQVPPSASSIKRSVSTTFTHRGRKQRPKKAVSSSKASGVKKSLVRLKKGTYRSVKCGALVKLKCTACGNLTQTQNGMKKHLESCARYLNSQNVSRHTDAAKSLVKKMRSSNTLTASRGRPNSNAECEDSDFDLHLTKFARPRKRVNVIADSSSDEEEETSNDSSRLSSVEPVVAVEVVNGPEPLFTCKYCNFTAAAISPHFEELRRHLTEKHPEMLQMFKCGHCDFLYGIPERLKSHTEFHHKGKPEIKEPLPVTCFFDAAGKENWFPTELGMAEECHSVTETKSRKSSYSHAFALHEEPLRNSQPTSEDLGLGTKSNAGLPSKRPMSADVDTSEVFAAKVTKHSIDHMCTQSPTGLNEDMVIECSSSDESDCCIVEERASVVATSDASDRTEGNRNAEDAVDELCRYICVKCRQRFTSRRGMEGHLTRHFRHSILTCAHCPLQFFSTEEMKVHHLKRHSEKVFNKKDAQDPMMELKMKRFVKKCRNEARKETVGSENSTCEVLAVSARHTASIQCRQCEVFLDSVRQFVFHCEDYHGGEVWEWVDVVSGAVYDMDGGLVSLPWEPATSHDMLKYLCAFCSLRATDRETIVQHHGQEHPDMDGTWIVSLSTELPSFTAGSSSCASSPSGIAERSEGFSGKRLSRQVSAALGGRRACVEMRDILLEENRPLLRQLLLRNGITQCHLNGVSQQTSNRLTKYGTG